MAVAVSEIKGGDFTIAPGEKVDKDKFSDDEWEALKAAGAIAESKRDLEEARTHSAPSTTLTEPGGDTNVEVEASKTEAKEAAATTAKEQEARQKVEGK